jgi:hypothetical protein
MAQATQPDDTGLFQEQLCRAVEANDWTNFMDLLGSDLSALSNLVIKEEENPADGLLAIHVAAQCGHVDFLEKLVFTCGVPADLPTAVLGESPLHYATLAG